MRTRSLVFLLFISLLVTGMARGQHVLRVGSVGQDVRIGTPAGERVELARAATFSSTLTLLIDPPAASALYPDLTPQLLDWFAGAPNRQVEFVMLGEAAGLRVRSSDEAIMALEGMVSAVRDAGAAPTLESVLAFRSDGDTEWTDLVYIGRDLLLPSGTSAFSDALQARWEARQRIRLVRWVAGLTPLATLVDHKGLVEVAVPDVAPVAGFRISPLVALGQASPWVWGLPLPTLAAYAEFVQKRALAALAGDAVQIELLLSQNPDDVDTLKLAAALTKDPRRGASYAASVVEREPSNADMWSRLGALAWESEDRATAERALMRARELGADAPASAGILGTIRFAQRDFNGAAPLLEEAVRREASRADLWLALADTRRELQQLRPMAQALEEVLRLQPTLWDRRAQLVEYYLQQNAPQQAAPLVTAGVAMLPREVATVPTVERFATFEERLGQRDSAIRLWTMVIELVPAREQAHLALARLHVESKTWPQALRAAEAGLEAVPASERLRAVLADALLGLGRVEQARLALRSVAPGPETAGRAAELEDRYGSRAPVYYRDLLERASITPEQTKAGLRVAIRERQWDTCDVFDKALASNVCRPTVVQDTSTTVIPGGFAALLFVARGPSRSSMDAALADYSRAVTTAFTTGNKLAEAYTARLVEYFGLLTALKAMGQNKGRVTEVRLSLENKQAVRATERVLAVLGWQTRFEKGRRIVENSVKGNMSHRQDLASALAIDVIAMQENLEAGKDFVLEVEDQPVEIFLDESAWQEQFYRGKRFDGGFAEALARQPQMASLYASLANMDQESAKLLISTVGMKRLAEAYGPALQLYAPALELSGGKVRVPGGNRAEPVWSKLTGEQPSTAGRFLRSLLDKDDGRLIRFYSLLSQLDQTRQRFFTASVKRTEAFYEAFRDSAQVEAKRSRAFGTANIQDLFRELPIDSEGKLVFPGSPEVWLVARNNSSGVQNTEKRLARISRVTTPEVEDEILLRLITKNYSDAGTQFEAWQNLLAVIRVDNGRAEPLDEPSALMLAEKYASHEGLFGALTQLNGLQSEHYREVFALAERIERMDWTEANLTAGLLHSGLYILGRAEALQRLSAQSAAALLLDFTKGLNQARTKADTGKVPLQFLVAFQAATGLGNDAASLRDVLVAAVSADPVQIGERVWDPLEDLRKNYDQVLTLQRVPPLSVMLTAHRGLLSMASGQGDLQQAGADVLAVSKFRDVEIPQKLKLADDVKELIKSSDDERFASLNKDLQKALADKKLESKKLQALAGKYWEALAFRAMLTMAGQVYATNFHPADLLIAEDPLLLRKHKFLIYNPGHKEFFPPGTLVRVSTAGGSNLIGTFSGVATMAGELAGDAAEGAAAFVAAAMLGSVRTTEWPALTAETLRSATVQQHAAQDWIVLAAWDESLLTAIADSTYGLLSLSRRARLLDGIRKHDWPSVWASVSRSDLFFLAARLRNHPVARASVSPSIQESLSFSDARLEQTRGLGAAMPYLRRRSTPALMELPPYEESAADIFPNYVAERVSEFKLYLAAVIVDEALPAAVLPTVAEAAAKRVLATLQMSSLRDWQAVLDGFEDFKAADLAEVFGGEL